MALKAAGKPVPDGQQQTIQAALDIAYADRPARDAVVQAAKDAVAEATDFVKAHDLITMPTAPVEVILQPEFQRGVAVAYCSPPGPLDKGQKTFFAVSPIPDNWTAAQTDSFLKEYNSRGIADVAVHEAMPGHYVQLWHSNQNPSVVRSVLWSGPFVEGWAVYAENLMAVEGFHEPRSAVSAGAAEGLSAHRHQRHPGPGAALRRHEPGRCHEADGGTAFQEEREAAGKWDRARMSATQLSTYFVGAAEHFEARARAEKKPGFALKAYHNKMLSFGSPPGRYAAALYFGDPVTAPRDPPAPARCRR